MKIKFTVLICSILVTVKAQVDCSRYQATQIINSLLKLSYVVNIDDATTGQGTFSAELVYAGLGWLSLGFNSDGFMIPSQAVIALPDDTTVQKYDLTSPAISGVLPSSSQTLQDVNVEQNSTHTVLRFTKLLMEDNELTIIGDGTNTFIWAYGGSNELGYHMGRGAHSLTLAPCIAEVVSPATSTPTLSVQNTSAPLAPVPDTSVPTTPIIEISTPSTSVTVTTAPITSAPTFSAVETSAPIASDPITSLPSGSVDCSTFQSELSLADGVTFRYTVNLDAVDSTTGVISAQIIYNGLAWLSLGFPDSIAGAMVPSNAVIGLPNNDNSLSNPGKYSLSSKALSGVTLLSDDRQTLKNHSIVQNDTHTILTFDKGLVESNEVPITLDTEIAFIWAYGTSNDLSYHADRGAFLLTVNACVPGAAPSIAPLVAGNDAPAPPTPESTQPTTTSPITMAPSTTQSIAKPTVAPSSAASIGVVDCSTFQRELSLANGVTFRYTVNLDAADSTTGVISAQIIYNGLAWLSLGFPDSIAGAMVPSNAVIGLPNNDNSLSNPGKYSLSSKALSGVTLLSDDRQTLKNHSIVQNDTHTILTFDKVLVESNEVPITLDTEIAFIWAYGTSNDLSYHADRGAFLLTINACVPGAAASTGSDGASEIKSPSTYRSLWSAHGILAGIAWGVMSPIAISSSLLRDLIPRAGLWFKIHVFLNLSVFVFTVIAFTLAIIALEKGTIPGTSADHFSKVNHRTVGLVIMVCVALQVLGGIIRPHAPGKNGSGEPEDKHAIRVVWEIVHKASGYGLLGTAWWQVQDGLKLYAGRFGSKDFSPVFWGVAGGIAGLVALLFLYSKSIVQRKTNEVGDLVVDDETTNRV